jgi:hypothetical protein
MNPRSTLITLVAASIVSAPAIAGAQSCTSTPGNQPQNRSCDVTVSAGTWSISKLGTMTISSTAPVNLSTPTTTDYDANIKAEPAGNSRTVTISANAPWDLAATPATVTNPSYWTAVNDLTYGAFVPAEADKPASDLKIGTTYDANGAGYTSLSTANNSPVAILSAQSPAAARVVNIYWATVWYYQFDTPGKYVLPFTLSLNIN